MLILRFGEGGAMYDLLTTAELNVLQSMLFEGTEDAFRIASITDGNPGWAQRYGPVHRDLGYLFIEAGTELLVRLDQQVPAAQLNSGGSFAAVGVEMVAVQVGDAEGQV
jgi:hypothetical protein